jgi:hypothetical protein
MTARIWLRAADCARSALSRKLPKSSERPFWSKCGVADPRAARQAATGKPVTQWDSRIVAAFAPLDPGFGSA